MDPDRYQMTDIKRRIATLEKALGYKLDRRVRELVNAVVAESVTKRIVALIEDEKRIKDLVG